MAIEILTLKEFLGQVREVLEFAYPLQYRITAEIARLNIHNQSGHCFPDLVEKEENVVVAKATGTIWKTNLTGILKKFREVVGEELKEGMKVLLVVEVRFHEVYGLRLNILDIDPSYTLGEFALTRKKVIAQLEKENLLTRNKQLPFPLVPQRIAIISSESSAGYEDFLNTLHNNLYGYKFSITL
ncbi:MAG: exodeoxyribonuclease VII large subunit, partial [Candidatus Omnitrophica bacterium]|nr:exodeoxyribonuclease VII large subunit [Candidatus Omnitrophota bacterium]